jgi:hypothetical protein
MSRARIRALEARRQALLAQCEEQRLELSYRLTQLRPAAQLTAWTRRAGPKAAANNPLVWIAGLLGLLLFARSRRLITGVGWVTALLALASRATALLRIIASLRALYLSLKSPKQ